MTANMPVNDTIKWAASRIGLSPALPEPVDRPAGRESSEDVLLALLDDPDRFVVAHVMLTKRARLTHEAFPTWNGLEVDVRADGTVHVDQAQRPSLRRRWLAWAASDPRPGELPPDPEGATS